MLCSKSQHAVQQPVYEVFATVAWTLISCVGMSLLLGLLTLSAWCFLEPMTDKAIVQVVLDVCVFSIERLLTQTDQQG